MLHKLLIINSNELELNSLNDILSSHFSVFKTTNWESAFLLVKNEDIDLILFDVNAETDDVSIKKATNMLLQIEKPDIPIIYTAFTFEIKTREQFDKSGASDIIFKPFINEAVLIKVDTQIKTKLSRQNMNRIIKDKTSELAKSRNDIIIAMSILAESRDDSIGDHIFRMQNVTRIIVNKYVEVYPNEMSRELADEIIMFSPLHDIGKVSIPDLVLKKPGKFSGDDFEVMQDHTIFGGQVLLRTQQTLGNNKDLLKVAIDIATYHHEKYDGTGYPYGLSGDEIPLSARIVALADVYDALISPRRYKDRFTHEMVMDIILCGDDRISPKHFDPKVLNAFKMSQDELKSLQYSTLAVIQNKE